MHRHNGFPSVNSKRDVSGRFVKTMTAKQKRKKHNKRCLSWFHTKKGQAYREKYYSENKEQIDYINRNNNYLRKYGITLEQKEEMLNSQNYKCLICQKIIDMSAAVDHDHETRKIRGILCLGCNTALGNFQDNIQLLKNAIEYLRGGE